MIITSGKLDKLCRDNTEIGPFTLGFDENEYIYIVKHDELTFLFQSGVSSRNDLNQLLDSTNLPQISLNVPASISFLAFVDIIYNHFIERFFFDTGRVKQSTIHELTRRLNTRDVGLAYTDILLNKLLELDIILPIEATSAIHSITNYATTPASTYYFKAWTQERINNHISIVPYSIKLNGLGYEWSDALGSWISPDAEIVIWKGTKYLTSQMKPCEECGEKSPHLHAGVCEVCLKIDPALIVIRNYQERAPSFIPFKVGKYSNTLYKTPLLFGIELEYESTNKDKALLDTARLLSHHAIFKRDGSIGSGFEIVTTAATFDYHEEVFTKFFDKFPSTLYSAENTGMHIHISRGPLNMLTQGKLVEFMNREDNRTFLKNIAGRVANHYTPLDPSRTISYPFLNSESGRYNTLNLNNEHTLEFRIFATPSDFKTFIQRLDFVRAIVAYCSPCQSKATTLKQVTHHSEFSKYVKEHKKDFPYFYEFLFPETLSAKHIKLAVYQSKSNFISNQGAI